MEVDVTDERTVRFEERPSSAGCVVAVVGADPAELDGGTAIALDVATVDVSLDCDEPEASGAVGADLDEGGTKKIDRITVPQIHLDDLPGAYRLRCHAPNLCRLPGGLGHAAAHSSTRLSAYVAT